MERQEASGVATVHIQVTRRFLLMGTGCGGAAASAVSASATRPHKEIDDR